MGVWVVVSLVAASNGGINSPNLLIYPVLIVLCGWLLGSRSTMGLLAVTGGLFAFFLWADLHGALPAMRPHNRWAYAVYLAGIVGLTAAATLFSRKSYLRRVHEAQTMAQDLKARDAELRKLLRVVEQSPESTVITDLEGRIEFVNDAFLARTGYARNEVLGRLSSEVSANGLGPAQWQGMRETLERGESWAGEQSNLRKDGAVISESVVVAPIRQPDGRITHYVELKQDVSDRKRAAQEIHRLAHYDSLTSLPNRSMRPACRPAINALATMCMSCCCWIWTGSPTSTMPEAARWATGCCAPWPCGWPSCWARTICWFVWRGTSLALCCMTWASTPPWQAAARWRLPTRSSKPLCTRWLWATLAKRPSWA